jgi:hypothetical protein
VSRAVAMLVLLAAGCRDATAIFVTVTARDVSVPGEIARVRLRVSNPASAAGAIYDSGEVALCAPGESVGCRTLPLTLALRPGDDQPDAVVRIEMNASAPDGSLVVRDAAQLTFASEQVRRVDFLISPPCLRSDCAAREQRCGPNGGCVGAGELVDPDAHAPPAEPITLISRVEENFHDIQANGPIRIPLPANTMPGDLILLETSAPRAAPWVAVGQLDSRVYYVKRAGAGEAMLVDDYTVSNVVNVVWSLWAFRGVDRHEVGLDVETSQSHVYTLPSYPVTRTGSYRFIRYPSSAFSECVIAPAGLVSSEGTGSALLGPLAAGPAGEMVLDCSVDQSETGVFELRLTPR